MVEDVRLHHRHHIRRDLLIDIVVASTAISAMVHVHAHAPPRGMSLAVSKKL
jgi:hypothetical protein